MSIENVEVWIDGAEAREMVCTIYNALYDAGRISLSADRIGYTEDFERLYERIRPMFPVTRNEVFCMLINERKTGRLRHQRD